MNQHYLNRYNRFIDVLKTQNIIGYSEKHHIIPKSLGGVDTADNLVSLTARQHYVAHWMLWKIYGGVMTTAFNYMNGIKRYGTRLNSKTAAILKHQEIERQKLKVFSEETRQKMRDKKLGRVLPEETKTKLRLINLGKKRTEEFCRKVSEAKKGKTNGRIGYTQSKETKLKIAEANFNRPIIQCPHCLKSVKDHGGARRWHFNNCKLLETLL